MRTRDTPTGSKRRIAAECGGTGDPGDLQPALELQLETRWGRISAPANEPLGQAHVPGVPAYQRLPPEPGTVRRIVADYPLSNRRFPIDRQTEGQKKAVLQENPASRFFEQPV